MSQESISGEVGKVCFGGGQCVARDGQRRLHEVLLINLLTNRQSHLFLYFFYNTLFYKIKVLLFMFVKFV
jgi:hypothetical protein